MANHGPNSIEVLGDICEGGILVDCRGCSMGGGWETGKR